MRAVLPEDRLPGASLSHYPGLGPKCKLSGVYPQNFVFGGFTHIEGVFPPLHDRVFSPNPGFGDWDGDPHSRYDPGPSPGRVHPDRS